MKVLIFYSCYLVDNSNYILDNEGLQFDKHRQPQVDKQNRTMNWQLGLQQKAWNFKNQNNYGLSYNLSYTYSENITNMKNELELLIKHDSVSDKKSGYKQSLKVEPGLSEVVVDTFRFISLEFVFIFIKQK